MKLIDIITLAIAYIGTLLNLPSAADLQQQVTDLTASNAAKDQTIAQLQAQVGADAATISSAQSAATQSAADARTAKDALAQMQSDDAAADAKGEELAALINAHPQTPNVDPATFAVTSPAPATPAAPPAQ